MTNNDVIDLTSNMYSTERGGVAYDGSKAYLIGDTVTESGIEYMSLTGTSSQPSTNPSDWKILSISNIEDIVTSKTEGNEIRIPEIVEITKANYDALGAGRPQKLYIIVN